MGKRSFGLIRVSMLAVALIAMGAGLVLTQSTAPATSITADRSDDIGAVYGASSSGGVSASLLAARAALSSAE